MLQSILRCSSSTQRPCTFWTFVKFAAPSSVRTVHISVQLRATLSSNPFCSPVCASSSDSHGFSLDCLINTSRQFFQCSRSELLLLFLNSYAKYLIKYQTKILFHLNFIQVLLTKTFLPKLKVRTKMLALFNSIVPKLSTLFVPN